MRKKLRVLLDVDGVILDFEKLFIQHARKVVMSLAPEARSTSHWDVAKGLGITEEQQAAVYREIDKPGVGLSMEPYPYAHAGVKAIANVADVWFVTSPLWSSQTWVWERAEKLKRLFGKELGGKVVHTRHKHLVVGDILVDDKPAHLDAWFKEMADYKDVTLPICWAHPFNSSCIQHLRLNDWAELLQIASQEKLSER